MSKLTFHTRNVGRLTESYIKQKLFPLTLRSEDGYNSVMQKQLHRVIKGEADDSVAVLTHKDNNLVAWSMTFDLEVDEPKFMIFVHPEYRKQGIGKKLTEKTFNYLKKQGHKEVFVAPWDDISELFYKDFSKGNTIKKRNWMFIKKKEL